MSLSRFRLHLTAWFGAAFVVGLLVLDAGFYVYSRRKAEARIAREIGGTARGLLEAIRAEEGRDFPVRGQVAFAEREVMHHLATRAAGEQALAIAREGHAVERLVQRRARDQFAGGNLDDDDFILPVAAVEHGRELAAGMHRDVHREITEGNLFADGPQQPLVRQPHRAVVLLAGDMDDAAFH